MPSDQANRVESKIKILIRPRYVYVYINCLRHVARVATEASKGRE